MTWDDRTNCKTRRHLVRGSAGQDKAFSRSITSTRAERQTGVGVVVAGWQHSQSVSQSVNYVFPLVSQSPYLPIFRGYLHGLWAGWANVGLAICHRLEPMPWTLSVPGYCWPLTILSSIDPVLFTFVNIIISGRGCSDLLLSTLPHLLSPFLISYILSHWSIQQIPRSEVISRKLPLHSLTVSI